MQADMPDFSPGVPDCEDEKPGRFAQLFPQAATFFRQAKLRMQRRDTALMRFIFDLTHGRRGEIGAVIVSWLGNGWLYFILVPFALLELEQRRISGLATAVTNIAVSHSIYPWLKKRTRRDRPFKADPSFVSLLHPRDEFSFPSGHTMTLAAFLVPLVYISPGLWVIGLIMLLIMGWARIAAGHHYPSDVFAGAAMGGTIGYVISALVLSG